MARRRDPSTCRSSRKSGSATRWGRWARAITTSKCRWSTASTTRPPRGVRLRPERRVGLHPLRLARPRPPDRHRLPGEPGQGGVNRLGIALPDRELACAPIDSRDGQRIPRRDECCDQLRAGQPPDPHAAHAARIRTLLSACRTATLFDVSHNTCKPEQHEVDGRERLLFVHRKGATRAFGPGRRICPRATRGGSTGHIGGSMGTGSYILAGTTESERRRLARPATAPGAR